MCIRTLFNISEHAVEHIGKTVLIRIEWMGKYELLCLFPTGDRNFRNSNFAPILELMLFGNKTYDGIRRFYSPSLALTRFLNLQRPEFHIRALFL